MSNIPLWAQLSLIAGLLLLLASFSIAEISLMAVNRHRLKHLANTGHKGAQAALWLLKRTDQLLTVLLFGTDLIGTILPVITTAVAVQIFGNTGWVLSITTGLTAFLIIVFGALTPKVIGAAFPERFALIAGFALKPLTKLLRPAVWFINLFVNGLMRVLRIPKNGQQDSRLSVDELRSVVMESGTRIPHKHRSILMNLFDLEDITVDDVMTPRARVESLNLSRPIEEVLRQLETCYHNKLPVHEGDSDRIMGILHVRKALSMLGETELTHQMFRNLVAEPYYIPSGTPVFQQLQFFQENRQRIGLIVNEYGDMQGIVTLEDILEEMIGEFTTSLPNAQAVSSDKSSLPIDGYLCDSSASLRDLNRRLRLHLPTDGPKTLNGLLLETLQEIPEAPVSVQLGDCILEIVQIDFQAIKTVRIYPFTQSKS